MKIIEKHNRKTLHEGRNYGMGFSFCTKNKSDYETVQPISPCKDYLNDVVYVENTGKEIGRIYGLEHKPIGCLDDKIAYLACRILHYSNGVDYKDYDKEKEALSKNYKAIEQGINTFEDILHIPKSVVYLTEDNDLLIEVPEWWYRDTWRISFYSLLVRSLIYYDGTKDVKEYLTTFEGPEKYYMTTSMPKMDKIITLKLNDKIRELGLVNKYKTTPDAKISTCGTVHSGGIVNLNVS